LWNTLGSVAAPLLLGFGALPAIGLRASVLGISAISVLLAWFVLPFEAPALRRPALAWAVVGTAVAAAIGLLLPADIRLWRSAPEDRLVDYREGVTCSVAVLDEAGGDRVLMLNNDYVLGGLKGAHLPRRQGLIPLLLHREPKSALFIGLGTGGSAGAAAACPDVRVDALEIVPEVIDMLRWFDPSNESLADRAAADGTGRIRILAVDGRHFVRATSARYDVAVGDLFLPYRAGEGAMYTREHVEAVRRVLAPGGLFCQWLPLYQFRGADLRVVVATFCDVFPHVEAFWLHANPVQPVLGLVGSDAPLELDRKAIEARLTSPEIAELLAGADLRSADPMLGGWIAGRETLRAWAAEAAVETRDRPRIEYSAPRNTILSPEDPSPANIAAFLDLTRSTAEAGPFERSSNDERERIFAFQRATGHLMLARPGSADAIDQLALALAEAPSWELSLGAMKRLGRESVDRGDLAAAHKAVDALSRCDGQQHAALYLSALLARRAGELDEARRLARAALALKPDHRGSRELLTEIGEAPSR
jgi:spermidine synthase